MKIFENIKQWFATQNKKEKPPEGICPNCWGRQEYGTEFYKAVKNNMANVNEVDAQKGWIQEYADKHLSGIAVNKSEGSVVCEHCKLNYVKED